MTVNDRTARAPFIAVALCAVLLNAGCFSTHRFDPDELRHLDGYQVRNEREVPVVEVNTDAHGFTHVNESSRPTTDKPYRMVSQDGEPFSYTSEKELYFITATGFGPGGQLEFIEVDEGTLQARTLDGEDIDMSVDDIAYIESRTFESQRTQLAVGAGILAVVIVATMAAGQ